MRTRTFVPILVLALGLVACAPRHRQHDPYPDPSRGGVHRGHGPPPHAPAHGYRTKMHGRHIEYDGGRGVYLVIGLPGIYWHAGWYYRLIRDRWGRSSRWDGPWHDSRWGDIPIGLRGGKGHHKGKDKGRGKGKGKKDRWD